MHPFIFYLTTIYGVKTIDFLISTWLVPLWESSTSYYSRYIITDAPAFLVFFFWRIKMTIAIVTVHRTLTSPSQFSLSLYIYICIYININLFPFASFPHKTRDHQQIKDVCMLSCALEFGNFTLIPSQARRIRINFKVGFRTMSSSRSIAK